MKYPYAFDLETYLLGVKNLAPKPVCITFAARAEKIESLILGNGDPEFYDKITDLLITTLNSEDRVLVGQNVKYDLHVLGHHYPEFYNIICQLYEKDLVHDTIIREKLLNLTTTGTISDEEVEEFESDSEGFRALVYKNRRVNYALDGLVKKYLHKDISGDKHGDVWRLKYHLLDGLKASQYPKEARDYALNDSEYLITIWEEQERKRKHVLDTKFFDPFKTLSYRCALDFHLYRMSIEGVHTNPEKIKALEEDLKEQLTHDKMTHLLENGILKPATEDGPVFLKKHEKGCLKLKHPITEEWLCDCRVEASKAHIEGCSKKRLKEDKTQWACDCPDRIKAGVKEGIRTKVFKEYVFDLWLESPDMKLRWSDASLEDEAFMILLEKFYAGDITPEEFQSHFGTSFNEQMSKFEEGVLAANEVKPFEKGSYKNYISTNKKFLQANSYRDDTLKEYAHRQSLQKLVTTEIPRMKMSNGVISEVIHPNYDILKETGRTSSFAGSLYPSANIQNVHSKVRDCFRARENHWILAVDYTALEFISAAQMTLNVMGRSKYAEIINKGWDSHSYLACQWALRNEDWFADLCKLNKSNSADDIYQEFMFFKTNPKAILVNGEEKDFWGHYRKSAKPVGLGILGGMGPATIAEVSNTVYRFHMTMDQAKAYREVFANIFPDEFQMLRSLPKRLKDYDHSKKGDDRYVYETVMGLRRPNCSYTAAANGSMLQSNSAEGATMGCMWISQESYDPTSESILKGNFKPWGFIHDEICGDVIANRKTATQVADRVVELLVNSLSQICPDVQPSATAEMMLVWSKAAYEVRDSKGLMYPYEHDSKQDAKKWPEFKHLNLKNLKEV
tara:strand:- start:55488 stop:58031 length:2544 start_codon:yes stop_codon:yes gene_type:complete